MPISVSESRPALASKSKAVSRLLWLEACILVALAHVLLSGYHLNVGNQTIQIPFLKHWMNPALYPNDPTVATIKDYPSYFFRGLAYPAKYIGIESTYLILHLVTAFFVLAAAYGLARAMFRDGLAGMILIAMLFAGHHHALAGDELYSPGFTHTWAAFPIALAVLILLYRDWTFFAFVLAGLLFNLHALTAAYLLAMMGLWAIFTLSRFGLRGWVKMIVLFAAFAAAASPTALLMIQHPQHFGPEWVDLTYLRSADHSFPASWWQSGAKDIPQFAMLVGLFAVSMSFPIKARQRRKTILMVVAAFILFAIGIAFADIGWVGRIPLVNRAHGIFGKLQQLVLRAQLFRSSRPLIMVMLAHIAYGCACGLRLWLAPRGFVWRMRGVIELISAAVTIICLAVPQGEAYVPYALGLAIAVAWLNGRLSWVQSAVVAAAGLIVLLAHQQIGFDLPGIGRPWAISREWTGGRLGLPFWIGLGGGIGIWLVSRYSPGRTLRGLIAIQGAAVAALLGATTYRAFIDIDRLDPETGAWIQAQEWARLNTPASAMFLTPPQSAKGGFRVYSERPVVCEWRDGTQMYFSGGFDKIWWSRFSAITPGLLLDDSRRHILASKPMSELSDAKLIDLAKQLGASYIVLPKSGRDRELTPAFENERFAIYRPAWRESTVDSAQALAPPPPDVIDRRRWMAQEQFIAKKAAANIEKYRKGRAQIEITTTSGRSVEGMAYDVHLTKHAFKFGASIPFFMEVEGGNGSDYKPPPVTQKELDRFLEVFNYTVIPFSAKWMYLEPKQGDRRFQDLDKYVQWCTDHDIGMEFHFISGLWPDWLRNKPLREQGPLFLKHAQEVTDRYAGRITDWQVVNDKWLLSYAPQVITDIRKRHPELRLGISDCTMFYARNDDSPAELAQTIYRGLSDVEALANAGTKLDYYAPHGHSPHGVWPDVHQMYDTFDKFAEQGLKIHVSEFQVPLYYDTPRARRATRGRTTQPAARAYPISGPIRKGSWTDQIRADFVERFYTVCFSHPAVESINYWNLGPASAEPGAGLLDENYNPTLTMLKLKELITQRWTTKVAGKLDSDGGISFKGFYGDYEIALTLPSGKIVKAKFTLPDGRRQSVIGLKLDEAKGTIQVIQ